MQTLHTPAFPFSRKPFPAGVLVVVSTPLYSSIFFVATPSRGATAERVAAGFSSPHHPSSSGYLVKATGSDKKGQIFNFSIFNFQFFNFSIFNFQFFNSSIFQFSIFQFFNVQFSIFDFSIFKRLNKIN